MDLILWFIIGANTVASWQGFNDYSFFSRYEFNVGKIKANEQIRMFTSGFLHVDTMHLIFNMLTLYFFAPIVIEFFGNIFFIIIYIGSLLAGNLLSFYLHQNENNYRAVGASGAVMGILYSSILLYPEMTLGLYFIIPIPGYIFGIGYLLYSIYGMKSRRDNIGHAAHFGGAIGGYAFTLVKEPSLVSTNLKMVILLLIPIIILFYLQKSNKL